MNSCVVKHGNEFETAVYKFAVIGTPSHSYGVSLVIWDHTCVHTPARQADIKIQDYPNLLLQRYGIICG